MKIKITSGFRKGRKGTITEKTDGGVLVLLDRKREKNYKHHKTEYVVFAEEGTYREQ